MSRAPYTDVEMSADHARVAALALIASVLGILAVIAWIEVYDWWNGLDPRTTAELRLAAWAEYQGHPVTWARCGDDLPLRDGYVRCDAQFAGGRPGTWTVYCPGDMSAETRCRWKP